MDLNHKVRLPDDLIGRCKAFGYQIVRAYAEGRTPNSLAVSSHGAEGNTELQAKAKMAECAFCIWAGQDPTINVHWNGGRCDSGYDIRYLNLRCDVKSIEFHKRFLIWPYRKISLFDSKLFDILVLVKEQAPIFWIAGWIRKEGFRKYHTVANATHALTEGTWYMHERDLISMDCLVAPKFAAAPEGEPLPLFAEAAE